MINTAIAIDNSREAREKSPSRYQMIRELEIDNFRCFSRVRVPDIRRFTVITGENGSGKTALLESLFVAGGGSPEIYIRTGAWRGNDELIISGEQSHNTSLFEDFFHKFDVEGGLRISFNDSNRGKREARIVLVREDMVRLPLDSKLSEPALLSGRKFIWKTPEGEFEQQIEVTPSEIRVPKPCNTYRMVFLNYRTALDSGQNAERYSTLSKKNQEKAVLDAISQLFPQVVGLSIQTRANLPAIYAQVEGIQNKMSLGLVSAGIHRFLSILLAITSNPRGAVLVDEVENGFYYKLLTPMWRILMKQCKENNCQLIVTTHSKEFLDSIAPLVERNKEDFSLLRTEWKNGEATVSNFSGEEFAAAITSGFEIR